MHHDCFVVFGDRIKSLLYHMASKWIHGEVESVSADSFSNFDDLFRSTMLKAALNKKISKSVHHQWVRLGDNGFDNFVLLLWGAHFQLLLQENGSLLVIIADNLVNDVLLVAVDVAIE